MYPHGNFTAILYGNLYIYIHMGSCKAIQYGNCYISVEIFPFRGNFIIDPLWELYYQSFMGTLLQSFGEILLYTCTEINEPCQLYW